MEACLAGHCDVFISDACCLIPLALNKQIDRKNSYQDCLKSPVFCAGSGTSAD